MPLFAASRPSYLRHVAQGRKRCRPARDALNATVAYATSKDSWHFRRLLVGIKIAAVLTTAILSSFLSSLNELLRFLVGSWHRRFSRSSALSQRSCPILISLRSNDYSPLRLAFTSFARPLRAQCGHSKHVRAILDTQLNRRNRIYYFVVFLLTRRILPPRLKIIFPSIYSPITLKYFALNTK